MGFINGGPNGQVFQPDKLRPLRKAIDGRTHYVYVQHGLHLLGMQAERKRNGGLQNRLLRRCRGDKKGGF